MGDGWGNEVGGDFGLGVVSDGGMNNSAYTYPPTATPAAPTRRQPSGWGKLWSSLGLGVLTFIILVIITLVVGLVAGGGANADQNTLMAVLELATGLVALLFVLALGGKAIAKPSVKGMGEAWKAAAWLFVADGIFVIIEIVEVALGIETLEVAPDWPTRVGILALLCLGVGIFEESMVRGLCLNGLLARMGRTRAGVYGAVILSSLVFGMMHFDFAIDFSQPLLVAQNIMKVVQTGMCGYLFAAILVKTRNLWTLIVIHAANDFMLLFLSSGLSNEEVATQYVQTGDEGITVLVLYCVLCALYLPFIPIGKRLIDQASPWRGGFYHYDQAMQTPLPTAGAPLAQQAGFPAAAPVATVPVAVAPVATAPAYPASPLAQPVPVAQPVSTQPVPTQANLIPGSIDPATAKAMRGKHAAVPRPSSVYAQANLPTEGIPHDHNL